MRDAYAPMTGKPLFGPTVHLKGRAGEAQPLKAKSLNFKRAENSALGNHSGIRGR
jgi:hypothetical protein